ncbi:hypothetical protein NLJ89_g7187 [Agrocybe chaxingu]|uniref:Uncharacterized protein n=1 Tax=Agrocybe chaxingu TaxID=84603 RepID=A0A9W8JXT3_9AGAR|nr:hypothetical protein NLJ89_g7187 [Agrocybe chaxingu]
MNVQTFKLQAQILLADFEFCSLCGFSPASSTRTSPSAFNISMFNFSIFNADSSPFPVPWVRPARPYLLLPARSIRTNQPPTGIPSAMAIFLDLVRTRRSLALPPPPLSLEVLPPPASSPCPGHQVRYSSPQCPRIDIATLNRRTYIFPSALQTWTQASIQRPTDHPLTGNFDLFSPSSLRS